MNPRPLSEATGRYFLYCGTIGLASAPLSIGRKKHSACKRVAAAVLLVASAFMAGAQPTPPTTRTDNFRESFHGEELVDPYHWLEDSTNSDTRQWIDAQNAYARAMV